MDDELPDTSQETPGWISPFRARKERKERETAKALANRAAWQAERAKEQQEWAAKSPEEKAQNCIENLDRRPWRTDEGLWATIYLLQALNKKLDRLLEVRKD